MAALDLDAACDCINDQADNINQFGDFTKLIDSFRYLRNLCTNPDNQKIIAQNVSILKSTSKILSERLKCNENVLCLQIGLQFLGNLIVNNKPNQEKVWLNCREVLHECLKFKNSKVQTCTAMILYNIFLGKPEFLNDIKESIHELIEMTLSETTSEFAVFNIELLILKTDYVVNLYDKLKQEHRLIILEIIKNLLVEQNTKDLNPQIIKFLSYKFIKHYDCILKMTESFTKNLDPIETIKILELLVAFSSDDRKCYFDIIVKETSLLINSVMLLRSVHSVSKEGGNDFSMISKISELHEIEKNKAVQEHPIFGFKCSLIQLIGNLCWKNVANQNKVRELDGIAVLLDCCNIDARNPFIMQWCILAIRNVCENNSENQNVIAAMSKQGEIDAAKLSEFGITLNTGTNGNRLCIAPLK